jgi:hypothetical protein
MGIAKRKMEVLTGSEVKSNSSPDKERLMREKKFLKPNIGETYIPGLRHRIIQEQKFNLLLTIPIQPIKVV